MGCTIPVARTVQDDEEGDVMNEKRIITVVATLLMLSICIAPMVIEDSDAANTERISENYLYHAQFVKRDLGDWYEEWYMDNYLYYIDGSEKNQQMERYISDPQRYSISSTDDRERINNSPAGTIVNVYACDSYYSEGYRWSISYNDQTQIAEKVLDPYGGISFFVTAGDTLEITINSITVSNGDRTPRAYVMIDYQYNYINPGFTHHYTTSTEVDVGFESAYQAVYFDVNYDAEGMSSPNGSATLYVVICAVITVLVLAILILASIRPKWSK